MVCMSVSGYNTAEYKNEKPVEFAVGSSLWETYKISSTGLFHYNCYGFHSGVIGDSGVMECNTLLWEWFLTLELNVAFILKGYKAMAVHSFATSETTHPIMQHHIQED
jgi:hypothetical protein